MVVMQFTHPKAMIYRAICERLETMDRITDAVECFDQMTTELGVSMNLRAWKWALGEC